MTKINIQKLAGVFPTRSLQEHGDCIVIPGDRFDPDWEADLAEQGHECFEAQFEEKPVTLVAVKSTLVADKGEKADSVGETKGVIPHERFVLRPDERKARWSIKEEQELIDLVPGSFVLDESKTIEEQFGAIGQKLGRTAKSVRLKYLELKRMEKREKGKGKHDDGVCPNCGLTVDICACVEMKKEKKRVMTSLSASPGDIQETTNDIGAICGRLNLDDVSDILIYCQHHALKEKAIRWLIIMVENKAEYIVTLVKKQECSKRNDM